MEHIPGKAVLQRATGDKHDRLWVSIMCDGDEHDGTILGAGEQIQVRLYFLDETRTKRCAIIDFEFPESDKTPSIFTEYEPIRKD